MAHELGRQIPTTQWSLIAQGKAGLSTLFSRYRPALLAHLIIRKRCRPEDAEDVLQGFIASQILEKDLIEGADPQRGKFRTYLLTALDRYLSNHRRHNAASKRSAGSPMMDVDDPATAAMAKEDASNAYELAWARQLLGEAIQRMERECLEGKRKDMWQIFEERLILPLLGDGPTPSYEELVHKYSLSSPTQASNLLITGKRMFIRILRNVVSEYVHSDQEIDEEIADLMKALGN